MLLVQNSVLSLGAVYSVMVETIFNSSRLYDYASPLPALACTQIWLVKEPSILRANHIGWTI